MSTAEEINMTWVITQKKPFFIDKRSIELRNRALSKRKKVGFRLPTGITSMPQESNLVLKNNKMTGFISSVWLSPTLNAVIGFAYCAREDAQIGNHITIRGVQLSKRHCLTSSPPAGA